MGQKVKPKVSQMKKNRNVNRNMIVSVMVDAVIVWINDEHKKAWDRWAKDMKEPKVMADIKAIKSMRVKLKKKANL